MTQETLLRRLDSGLMALGIPCVDHQHHQLLAFLDLLKKWNRTYNLTAIRDLRLGVDLHLLDSAAIGPFLREGPVLDVGTGAGLPGIPLAILYPEIPFVLLDGSAKKIRFVRQAAIELGLSNVEGVAARIEDYRGSSDLFGVILARAFARLETIHSATARLMKPHGRILAMKGRLPADEISHMTMKNIKIQVHRLSVPGVDAERHVIEMRAD